MTGYPGDRPGYATRMSIPHEPGHAEEPEGPVPPDNQPGHHPAKEQDKPDLHAFAERLGTAPPAESDAAGPAPGATSSVLASRWGLAALAAAVLVVVGVVVGRTRRSRRSR